MIELLEKLQKNNLWKNYSYAVKETIQRQKYDSELQNIYNFEK